MRFAATVGDHSVTVDYPLPRSEVCVCPAPLRMLKAGTPITALYRLAAA